MSAGEGPRRCLGWGGLVASGWLLLSPAAPLPVAGAPGAAVPQPCASLEVGAFYWTVLAPDIVNPGREEQGSASV